MRGRPATRPARYWCSTRSRAGSGAPAPGSPASPRASCRTCSRSRRGSAAGCPIGACIGLGAAGTALRKGDHGSTFGGNPVACAAALAVLDTIERDGLLARAAAVGQRLADGIAGTSHPLLGGVRGAGLWLAAVLTEPAAGAVEAACRDAGFLVNAVQPDAIRLAPPLILSDAEAGAFLAALPRILDRAAAQAPAAAPEPERVP